MRDIKIIPGYYEWNIFSNDDFVYSLGDLGEDIDYYKSEDQFADEYYDWLVEEAKDDYFDEKTIDFINSLSEEESQKLKQQFKNVWNYYN